MIITKTISYGTIDVDPDDGKIWINCPNCILRMKNLRFNKIEEKYSMIDIINNEAWMLSGSFPEDLVSQFIENLVPIILEKIEKKSDSEIQESLDDLLEKIRKEK